MKKKRALLLLIVIICMLPGCSTISRGKSESWVISKAHDTVAHGVGRYLHKKTTNDEPSELKDKTISPSGITSDPSVRTDFPTRDISLESVRSQAKSLTNLMLSTFSSAFGVERIKPKAHHPSDALSRVDPCFYTGSPINDSFVEIEREERGKPVAKFGHRKLFLGFRIKFIALSS